MGAIGKSKSSGPFFVRGKPKAQPFFTCEQLCCDHAIFGGGDFWTGVKFGANWPVSWDFESNDFDSFTGTFVRVFVVFNIFSSVPFVISCVIFKITLIYCATCKISDT